MLRCLTGMDTEKAQSVQESANAIEELIDHEEIANQQGVLHGTRGDAVGFHHGGADEENHHRQSDSL